MNNLYRTLRTKEIRAQITHRCDFCDEPIFPGDVYLLKISAIRSGKYRCLRVEKEHVNPLCPPDDHEGEVEFVRAPVVYLTIAA